MGIEDIEADLNNDTSKKHIMSFVANIIHIYIYVCIYIKSYIIDNYIYIHIIYIYISRSLSLFLYGPELRMGRNQFRCLVTLSA